MELLKTHSLKIGYREKDSEKVLQKNINISLEKGQIISLVGQNGVGKTTFIKTLSGLLEPLDGEVFFDSRNLKEIPKNLLATKFSVVLTEKPVSSNLTVKELVSLGRHPYSSWLGILSKDDQAAVEEAIDKTHINYISDKKLYQLSDGQLQKVMIARALAQETDLIFLDEPTAHLDLHNKIEIMYLLKDIAKEGKGILISTHDLHISTQVADILWLFNFNEPVIQGTPEDLILDGSVERTLFLQEYNYDFKSGYTFEKPVKSKIQVKGTGDRAFWTSIALQKQGYEVVSESAEIEIIVKELSWEIKKTHETEELHSIEDLLNYIK